MKKTVTSVQSQLTSTTWTSMPAAEINQISPTSSVTFHKQTISSTVTSFSPAIYKGGGFVEYSNHDARKIAKQNDSGNEVSNTATEEPINLVRIPPIETQQTTVTMETELSGKKVSSPSDKSSHEIAAEALCLMRFGGGQADSVKSRPAQSSLEGANSSEHNYGNPYIVMDSEPGFTHTQTSLPSSGNCSGQNSDVDSNSSSGQTVFGQSSHFENILKIDDCFGERAHINDIDREGHIISCSVEKAQGSDVSNAGISFSSERANETIPASNVATVTKDASKDLVKYVLLPESALSSVFPGDLSSLPRSSCYIMLPKGKSIGTVSKPLNVTVLNNLNQCQRQLLPKVLGQIATGQGKVTKGQGQIDKAQGQMNKFEGQTVSATVTLSENAEECTIDETGIRNNLTVQTVAMETKSVSAKRNFSKISKNYDALKFPPCIICEGEASGFHYGCNTCEACKNFFRRCLLRKSTAPFVCHNGTKNCEISFKKNKNNCSACRLAKCLQMGMAKEKCKMGRYTALMRTETIKKVRKLEGKDTGNIDVSVTNSPETSSDTDKHTGLQVEDVQTGFSTDVSEYYDEFISQQISNSNKPYEQVTRHEFNEKTVNSLARAMEDIKPWGENLVTEEARMNAIKDYYDKYKAKVDTFGLGAVSMQDYQVLLRKYGIDIDSSWEKFKQCTLDWEAVIGRYCKFAKCIPEFSSLSFNDQACLLKITHFDFFTIIFHEGYIPEYGVFLDINGVPLHIDEASDKFLSRDLVLAMIDMMTRLQKMHLSKAEMALLMSVVTMSTDQCSLENPTLVESTQLHLVDLLLKETYRKYGQPTGRRRFTALIDILTKMREVSNIYFKEYRYLCEDDLIRKEVPNIDIVLPDTN